MGNPLFDGTYTYTWDRGRQLVGVTGPDFVATYKYNAAGQRISKTVNGVTTHFTYAGDQLIRQSDGTAGGTIHFYYDANGELIGAWPENSQTYTYLRNAQGDIVGHIDNRSTSRYNYAYDAWGNHTLEDNNYFIKGNPFRYRGYYYDEETGFYFCQSRYYNPEWRRWLNADAYMLAGNVLTAANMYAYCDGNPVNLVDPTGMDSTGIAKQLGQGIALGVLVGAVYHLLVSAVGLTNDQAKTIIIGIADTFSTMEDLITGLANFLQSIEENNKRSIWSEVWGPGELGALFGAITSIIGVASGGIFAIPALVVAAIGGAVTGYYGELIIALIVELFFS